MLQASELWHYNFHIVILVLTLIKLYKIQYYRQKYF